MSRLEMMGVASLFILMVLKRLKFEPLFVEFMIRFIKLGIMWIYSQRESILKAEQKAHASKKTQRDQTDLLTEKRVKIVDFLVGVLNFGPPKKI